jgi:hypothetical protein
MTSACLGRTNRLFSFDMTRTAYKITLPIVVRCRGNVSIEFLPSNHRTIQRHTHSTILVLLRVIVTAELSSPSRCLAMKGGIYFTDPLASNHLKDIYRDIQTDVRDFFCSPILSAICTNAFSKLYKRIQRHVEECSVALLCN